MLEGHFHSEIEVASQGLHHSWGTHIWHTPGYARAPASCMRPLATVVPWGGRGRQDPQCRGTGLAKSHRTEQLQSGNLIYARLRHDKHFMRTISFCLFSGSLRQVSQPVLSRSRA